MSERVLVINDEANIRRLMRLTLEAAGYEVGEASDGERGLAAYKDGAAWDAVLLDQKMPGMDGLDVLRASKGRDKGARVIMMTAFASIELAVDAMKLGASDSCASQRPPKSCATCSKPRWLNPPWLQPTRATLPQQRRRNRLRLVPGRSFNT